MRSIYVAIGFLAALLVACVYGLTVGQGSFQKVAALEAEKAALVHQLEAIKAANAALEREIRFLESGLDAVEERARYELNMIGENEVLFKIN